MFKGNNALAQHFRQCHPMVTIARRHGINYQKAKEVSVPVTPSLKQMYQHDLKQIENEALQCPTDELWQSFVDIYKKIEATILSKQPQLQKRKRKKKRSGTECSRTNDAAKAMFEKKKAQFLFFNKKKSLWNWIKTYNHPNTNPVATFNAEQIYNHFSGIFSIPKENRLPFPLRPKPAAEQNAVNLLISEEQRETLFHLDDVKKSFQSIPNDTSSGPDNIRIKTIKDIDPDFSIHWQIFNIQLLCGKILPQWCKGRLCLLPKPGKDPNYLSNHRPLTIYNVGLRAMMKLLTRIVYPYTNLHPAQTGFIPGLNGIDNVYKVKKVLEHAKKYGKELWITSFDARAAFDSGSRLHMKDCIESLGLPERIKKLYLQTLEPTQVTCTCQNIVTHQIAVVNGVGQGRPESSLTFNLSIDHIIRCLDENIEAAYQIDTDKKIKVLAYADDIITFASTQEEAVKQAKCVVEMLRMIGMDVNTEKCVCAAINTSQPSPDNNSILSEAFPIPVVFGEHVAFKYLGCEINTKGAPDYDEWSRNIAANINNLISFPHIFAWQRMDLLKNYIMSQLPYKSQIEAENQPYNMKAISDLCDTIQQSIKAILGLNCLPLCHVYGSRPAGMACPNATWTIINNCMIALTRLKCTNDVALESLNNQLQIDYHSKLTDASNALQKSNIFENRIDLGKVTTILNDEKMCKSRRLTTELRQQCISLWCDTNTGLSAGATLLKQSIVSKSALEYAVCMTESQFKATVQIRSGCVNLRTRPHQRKLNKNNINCRLCQHSIESIGHVLGECKQLHGYIIKRHDAVVDVLYQHLCSIPNSSTTKEQVFHIGNKALKPDIVHTDSFGKITIIDPTVRTEKDSQTREEQITEKFLKYAILKQHLAERHRIDEDKVTICPLWIGSRGTILKPDIDLLEKSVGKLPKDILFKIASDVVSWSATIYNALVTHK